MRTLESILMTMKPKRWWRALVILFPLLFYSSILNFVFIIKLATAFVIFSLLTGAISIIDDIRDKEKDKSDPTKRTRPVASGEISKNKAEFSLAMILTGSFVAAFFLGTTVGLIAVGYFLTELAYFFFLKNFSILDAINVSLETGLLLLAGILAGGKDISPWLFVFVLSSSMFFFYCEKIRAVSLGSEESAKNYDKDSLAHIINIFACFSLLTYTFYAIIAPQENGPNLIWTLPFLVYAVSRTIFLTSNKENSENLETVLLKDRATWINAALWAISLVVLGFIK